MTEATEIFSGLWISGEIPRHCAYEDTGGPFYLDKEKKQKDQLYDDMSLWLEGEEGITVICGCCHSGIINTLSHIKQHIGQSVNISHLIGGLHLVSATPQRMTATLDYFYKQNIDNLYPAHCTGDKAMLLLSQEFKNSIEIAKAGLKISL